MALLTIIDGALRVDANNTLVLSPDDSSPCCCNQCKYCVYFSQYDNCSDTINGNRKYQKTITVPAALALPVKVVATGSADDIFMLDGDGSVFGQDPRFGIGTPAHSYTYTWTQTNRTFTVEALDTRGYCTGITYTICMMPLDADPGTTELCEPLVILEGSDPNNPPPTTS